MPDWKHSTSTGQGRPFLDAIEARFGIDPRRQRVDFELKRVDVLVAVPTEARAPGQVRAAPPSNLLLLGFSPATAFLRGGEQGGLAARQALLAVLDREALAGLLPPGRAHAAKAFLPGWVSGYDFLLGFGAWRKTAPARPLPQPAGALPRGPFRLIYDAADPVAELAASRLALDLRGMGMELRPQGLPGAGFRQARQAGRYDLFLESVSLRVEHPAAALADLLSPVPVGKSGAGGSAPDPVASLPRPVQFPARPGTGAPEGKWYAGLGQCLEAIGRVGLMPSGSRSSPSGFPSSARSPDERQPCA